MAGPTAQAAQAVQGMQRLGRHRGHCVLRKHSREMHHPSLRLEHFQISGGESGQKVNESTKLRENV